MSTTSLRGQRKAAGLSQQRLAEMAGCSISMVKLLEQGLRPTQSDVLSRIEQVLGAQAAQHDCAASAPTDRVGEPGA